MKVIQWRERTHASLSPSPLLAGTIDVGDDKVVAGERTEAKILGRGRDDREKREGMILLFNLFQNFSCKTSFLVLYYNLGRFHLKYRAQTDYYVRKQVDIKSIKTWRGKCIFTD
jgi:hypothetical protein